jgi:hypothetical protein
LGSSSANRFSSTIRPGKPHPKSACDDTDLSVVCAGLHHAGALQLSEHHPPQNAREWDDTYKARIGLARAADLSGDMAGQQTQQRIADEAKAKADAVRAKSIERLPAAERDAITRQ